MVEMRYAVGVGMPLEVDEEVVEDAVVLEGWSVVFVSVVAVVPEAWFVSVFVAVSAVVGAGVVVSSPPPSSPLPPEPPLPPLPPPAAPPAPVSDEVDVEVVEVGSDPEPLSVVVPGALVIGAIVESEPEPLSVVVPEPLSVVESEALAVDVIVESEAEALAMVPVTEAVTVEATVVIEIDPAPVCKLTHSASSVQKSPPQVKTSVPQQTKGTLKVSPTERVSIPGFASAKHVALRKSSLATWLSEAALIEMSCPRVKPRSSTAAAAARKKKWGIEAWVESCRSK